MSSDLQDELQSTLGAGYRVTRELTGGGMSRVFVAEEASLEREIVVKLLPPELMAGLNMERFRAEVQHAVRLQHPHIVPVLSAGLIEYRSGVRGPYYTMPFIRGETLRARLEREGTLAPEEVRRILMDVVDALAHAHEAGIVHRDIKPDNVFLVGKNAMVTDFGVSKALQPTTNAAPVTGVGVTLGTPGYMAPEQASGDGQLDQRADLYSVGVMAYELLTGRRPFIGSTFHQLLVAQAVETPVPIQQANPSVPPGLAAAVMRCLEKRPEDRFQSASELLAVLEALGSGSHTTGAVLAIPARRTPLARWVLAGLGLLVVALGGLGIWRQSQGSEPSLGAGHEASVALLPPEYFQPDSLTPSLLPELVDQISNNLGRIEGLRVVSYLSAGALYRRGASPTLREVGEKLGSEHLVVFQPRNTSRGQRLSVQLIEAPTMVQVWAAPYEPDSTNFDQIVTDVVSRVTHSLLGREAARPIPASARARRAGAQSEFLAGQQALRRRTPDGISLAIRHFEQAIRLDSTHAAATGRLATGLGLQLAYGYRTTLNSYATAARALALAERAVALGPDQGEPVGFLAYIEYLNQAPIEKVRTDFERAIRMRASEADVAGWHALLLLRQGKTTEALAEAQRALDLDPMSSPRHLGLALPALAAGRAALAALEARRAGELEPDLRRPRQVEGLALLLLDRTAECLTLDLYPYLGVRAMCLQAAGRRQDARALVDSLVRMVSTDAVDDVYADVLPAQELATWYAWNGNAKEALAYVRLAFARSPVGIDSRIVQSSVFDRVRGTDGFQEELRRLEAAVWPRVLEQRQRIEAPDGTTPLAVALRPSAFHQ